jgi:hypothetical protein
MHIIQLNAGTLTASMDTRTATGLLVPFGEECSSNIGKFTVDPGGFEIPEDLTGASLNIEHQREEVVGTITQANETDQGIVATFAFAKTPAGDAALESIASGERKNLSAEVADVIIKSGKAIGGRLFAAALVAQPAFPSATLLASAPDTLEAAAAMPVDPNSPVDPNAAPTGPQTTVDKTVEEYTDENGVIHTKTTTVETTIDGSTTTIITTEVIDEPPATPADNNGGNSVTNATVPATLQASATTEPQEPAKDKAALLSAINNVIVARDTTALLALSDVKMTGTSSLESTLVPEYVGQLWDGRRYARKVIPLLSNAALTSYKVMGWKFGTEPAVDTWAGNKASIPSNSPTVTPYEVTAQAFAGGWDIDRRFYDFGETAVIESLMQRAVDSYAKKSDDYALAQIVANATSAAVGTIPTGVESALVKLVRGGLRVINNDALPTFAIVAPDVYESLLLIKTNNALEFLSTSLGLEGGSMTNFQLIPHAGLSTGQVLVGAREAATVRELPGSPIRVNAQDISKGGVDEAIFGYCAIQIDYPAALQLVTSAS